MKLSSKNSAIELYYGREEIPYISKISYLFWAKNYMKKHGVAYLRIVEFFEKLKNVLIKSCPNNIKFLLLVYFCVLKKLLNGTFEVYLVKFGLLYVATVNTFFKIFEKNQRGCLFLELLIFGNLRYHYQIIILVIMIPILCPLPSQAPSH